MSWLEDIQSDLIITTGDGETYTPQWINATKNKEFNIAEFDFPNIPGTLVRKSAPRGRRYSLEIYFQGDDHLDVAAAFDESSNDSRAWTLDHPFYGLIIVQPISLSFDNTQQNVTKITGTIVETITDLAPQTSEDPRDKIENDSEELNEILAASFVNDVDPSSSDVQLMTSNLDNYHAAVNTEIIDSNDAEKYFNLFTTASSAILNASSEPLAAINAMQAVINAPALFIDSAKNRVNMMVGQFNRLLLTFDNIIDQSEKKIYENNGAAILSGMSRSAATPDEFDYNNRDDVFLTIEILIDNYNKLIKDLDSLQTDNGGSPTSYIPDADSILALDDLVKFAVSRLYDIALNASQERIVILEDDSNVVNLTHRFYGLDVLDENIDTFIQNNDIGLSELLLVKKDRTIRYYI